MTTLREQVGTTLLQYMLAIHAELIHSHDDVFLTDQIISTIKEEIEGCLLTQKEVVEASEEYTAESRALWDSSLDRFSKVDKAFQLTSPQLRVAQAQLKAILDKLEEK